MAQTPFLLPLLVPLWFPFHLLGIPSLCGAIPSTLVSGCSWTGLPLPKPFPVPPPFQIPNTPGQLCAILRRHSDSGFTRSGTKTIQNSSSHNSLFIHIISWDWPFTFEINLKKVAKRDSVTLNAISYNILAFLRIAFMSLPLKCLFYSTVPFVESHCTCSGHS
jgi:hypothetical protein